MGVSDAMDAGRIIRVEGLSLVRKLYGSDQTGRALYHVRDRDMGVQYALKQLALESNSEREIRREVVALNRLPFGFAPHCHRMFKDSGNVYILMDWVEGEPLSSRFVNPPLDRHDLIWRLEALSLASKKIAGFHRANIWHRDIKPDNIILRNAGRRDQSVEIIDFGLSVQRRGIEEGTVHYRAPEQHLLRHKNITASTDIFSLGQVAWYLLTGAPRVLDPNLDWTDWDIEGAPRPSVPVETPGEFLSELDRATAFRPERRHNNISNLGAIVDRTIRTLRRSRNRRRRN